MKTRGSCFGILLSVTLISSGAGAFDIPRGQALHLKNVSAAIRDVSRPDLIKKFAQATKVDMASGFDDVLYLEETQTALLFGADYFIHHIDLKTGKELWNLRLGMYPAGAKRVPYQPDKVYFCAARGEQAPIDQGAEVGLYELDLTYQKITPLITRLPVLPKTNEKEILFASQSEPGFQREDMNATNSREFSVCNDLAFSDNGERVYITEPYSADGATVGGKFSQAEAFMVTQRGQVWKWDRKADRIGLVAQNFSFTDGIAVQKSDSVGADDVLVVTELSKYRILQMRLSASTPQWSVVVDNLPGSPDGLTLDSQGRLWSALIKERTKLLSWAHRHPYLKRLLLRLPDKVKPSPKGTGFLVLDLNLTPILASMHDGSKIRDISAIEVTESKVLFASIQSQNQNLFSIDLNQLFKER